MLVCRAKEEAGSFPDANVAAQADEVVSAPGDALSVIRSPAPSAALSARVVRVSRPVEN